MSSRWFTRLLFATVASLLCSTAAIADPPGRVARISFIAGAVSFRPASLDDWSAASLNYPATIGDHMWTDRGARAELELGSTAVRVAPLSEISVLNLDDHTAQLRVTQGAVVVRVRTLGERDILEIDTPNGAMSVLRAGLYRVDVNDAGDSTTLTVRDGEADIATGTTAFPLRRDQSVVLTGVDAAAYTSVAAAVRIDSFEDWCLQRDRRADALPAARYVSPELIGYADLDANGTWQVVPEYGPVWVPRVRADWAPYRFGHWAWVEPWGWTWIDDAPWGFAPFHYGRWASLPARGWVWVPGTFVAQPVYAPALVAFVGGSNWSVSTQFGARPIGWFPLGPREVFVPAYRVTPDYVQRVNVAHVTNINVTTVNIANTYVNRTVPGAVTVVPRQTFVQAQPVAAAAMAISRDQAQAAPVVGAAAVAPQRASVAGPPQAAAVPPASAVTRQVVVRSPPPPAPASFTSKQGALEQHPGQPVDAPAENPTRVQTSQTYAPHPLVRVMAAPRPVTGSQPVPVPRAQAPAAPNRATSSSNASPSAPAPAANPSAGRPASQMANDTAARHAQQRAEIDARHARERAALQARHEQERQAAQDSQRAQMQQRHQQETKALQEQHKRERDAAQKRQQEERRNKGSEPR